LTSHKIKATLIGYMESIAIGKNLAATNGYDIDAGQEMLALGIANVVGVAWPFKKDIVGDYGYIKTV